MPILVIVIVWIAFVILAATTAVVVALFQSDHQRRKDAVQVLRAVLRAGTFLGVVAAVMIELHQAGLI
jgi:hypothetical protein